MTCSQEKNSWVGQLRANSKETAITELKSWRIKLLNALGDIHDTVFFEDKELHTYMDLETQVLGD